MSPKRGAYPKAFRDEAVRMFRAGRDLRELAQELGVTPGSLQVWIIRAEGGTHRPPLDRRSVVAATEGAYERFDSTLRSAPPSALEGPMGFASEAIHRWRVADAVAHVAHYKARVIQRLVASGRSSAMDKKMDAYADPETWDELKASDPVYNAMDAFTRRRHGVNHLVFERWRDASAKEILAWHGFVHRYVVTKLKDAPDSWFDEAARVRLTYSGFAAIAHHPDTHLKDITRALESRR